MIPNSHKTKIKLNGTPKSHKRSGICPPLSSDMNLHKRLLEFQSAFYPYQPLTERDLSTESTLALLMPYCERTNFQQPCRNHLTSGQCAVTSLPISGPMKVLTPSNWLFVGKRTEKTKNLNPIFNLCLNPNRAYLCPGIENSSIPRMKRYDG